MNLSRFISSLMFMLLPLGGLACGPFDALTSNPFVFHFYQEEDTPTIIESQKDENISLWQAMTSPSIPLTHIESAVYGASFDELRDAFDAGKSDNRLLDWIMSHKSNELKDFLLLAKELEELRFNRVSDWYYQADKTERYESRNESEKFASILERCERHASGLLSDRYGLQHIRALMALCRYDECIELYDKRMSKLPDDNLFKRMAKGYVAGCHRRSGNNRVANRMYAEVGDFNSVVDNKESYFITMVENNPESAVVKSRLNRWIGYGDRADNLRYLGVANAALKSSKTINRGDWLYLKAYIEETYNGNHSKALAFLKKALASRFSKEEMRNDAKIMELCLKAEMGDICKDLRCYLEAFKADSTPFFFYIVPALLKKGYVSEALLLANYASYLYDNQIYSSSFYSLVNDSRATVDIDDNTYATTGFQLMLSRSAQEIINYKKFLLQSNREIVKECKGRIRHDDDFLNEIIGTLFMREGDYAEAEQHFLQVSESYQQNMNIKKCGYLFDNPWVNCYMPEDKWEYPSSKDRILNEEQALRSSFDPANSALLKSDENAKLNFAHEMVRLDKTISNGTPDERGLARIRYALARYNSFEKCWALTQYWKGDANQCNYRPFIWLPNGGYKELDYLKEMTGSIPDKDWLDAQLRKGMKELRSEEALAEAHFLIGNYKTVAKKYPCSHVWEYLSKHCDSWHDWL